MPLHLFEGFGVELEYMLVDAETLAVLPAADELLRAANERFAGSAEIVGELDLDDISWSNELVLHVLELKTNGPVASLNGLAERFQEHVGRATELLKPRGGRLLPGGMHPLMDPLAETRIWPHDYSPVYQAFNRIFDCRGHGWSNLQSVHLNLPFADDEEFGRLHAAIRLLLPILPALAASSPVADGRLTGQLDTRLEVYRTNSIRIPKMTGSVIPEPVFSRAAYEAGILQPLYRDLAPHDPAGTLQEEWANARGAIARFERNTIEIRVLDVQECPAADVAICAAAVAALRALVTERWSSTKSQQAVAVEPLARIFLATLRDAERTPIADPEYLKLLGLSTSRSTAGDVWRHLVDETVAAAEDRAITAAIRTIVDEGPLSRRLIRSLGEAPSREQIATVYRDLADCLSAGRMFTR